MKRGFDIKSPDGVFAGTRKGNSALGAPTRCPPVFKGEKSLLPRVVAPSTEPPKSCCRLSPSLPVPQWVILGWQHLWAGSELGVPSAIQQLIHQNSAPLPALTLHRQVGRGGWRAAQAVARDAGVFSSILWLHPENDQRPVDQDPHPQLQVTARDQGRRGEGGECWRRSSRERGQPRHGMRGRRRPKLTS